MKFIDKFALMRGMFNEEAEIEFQIFQFVTFKFLNKKG